MPLKVDLTALEIFVAVCECRGITRAAELTSMSPSAVSKRISQLEEFAGVPLLIRTHAGVAPTNEGIRLLEHARNLLYNAELLERDVAGALGNSRGHLRVLANRSANAAFVGRTVACFLAESRHRNIDVQIAEATSHEVVSGVKNGFATLGVCWAATDMTGVEWRPTKRDHLCVVVPTGHPLANRKELAFAETLDYEHVGITFGGPITHILRQESMSVGKRLRYRVLAPTLEAMIDAVTAGGWIATVPASGVLRHARSSEIVVIPLSDAWKERQFAVCCRSRRALSRPAAELFDQLAALNDVFDASGRRVASDLFVDDRRKPQ